MPEELKNSPLSREYQAIDKEYKRDVALTEAGPLLVRILFGFFVAVDLAMLAFSLAIIGSYAVNGSFIDARRMADIGNNVALFHSLSGVQGPDTVELGTARVVSGSDGKYDLVAEVTNPNPYFTAHFSYHFVFDGAEGKTYEGFLNPLETRLLPGFATPSTGTPRNVRVVIDELSFARVSRHEVQDVEGWLEEHQNFPVADVLYSGDIELGAEAVGQTDFTLTNRTPYSYWDGTFLVLLERGSQVSAVTEIHLKEFLAGESRQVNVRWTDPIPASATLRVVPVLDYQDPAIYMKPQE